VWVATVFTKNPGRLLEAAVAHKFLAALLNYKEVRRRQPDEHFSVDGTQGAWAPMQNFRAKDGSGQRPAATANVTSMARGAATIRQRPGGKALLQGQRLRGQALLHRQRADPSTALV
jgi:hypothetical protein